MERQQELSAAHLRLFLAIVLRNPTIFAQFKSHLTPEAFSDGALGIVWQAAVTRQEATATLPTFPELIADVRAHAGRTESIYDNPYILEHVAEADRFLRWAFDPTTFQGTAPDSPSSESFAFRSGQMLLLRAHNDQTLRQLASSQLQELPFVLREAQARADLFASFGAVVRREEVFAEGWDRRSPQTLRTTGFSFFDRFMGGGEANGEAYVFMAPLGTCKTVLSVMKWVASARQAYTATLADGWDGRKGLSVLVSYEASLNSELQHRALSYAAKIHKDRLQAMGHLGLEALNNDPYNPLPYEHTLFAREISDGMFVPERQRVSQELGWMNSHLVCFDFSGASTENSAFANGGISGLVQRLQATLRAWGDQYYVHSVVIDYLGLMADRYNVTLPPRAQQESHVLYQASVDAAVNTIAKPYDCPVWIMHQLSGEANARLNPTSTMHHTQAKGSKLVGENAAFCFVVGHLTAESMGVLSCTKHRRYKPLPNTVIQVVGEFNNMRGLDNYSIDSRGQIVDRATMNATVGPRAAARTEPVLVDDVDPSGYDGLDHGEVYGMAD